MQRIISNLDSYCRKVAPGMDSKIAHIAQEKPNTRV